MTIESVILAAGFSSRCQTNKMLLPIKNKTVIEQCIHAFCPSCTRIIVVTGRFHDEMKPILEKYDKVDIIYNHNYPDGMFSSIKVGVSAIRGDRFFITPGDYPFITPETIHRMLHTDAELVKPIYKGVPGHPILLKGNLKSRILTWPNTNLRDCLSGVDGVYEEVFDKGVVTDIDTMEDYKNITDGGYGSFHYWSD